MMNFEQGEVLLFDKPYTWTSFDLVKKVRNIIRVKKVGHAGTLDPLATGLMILCTGPKTKTIESLTGMDKTYTGTLLLGQTTPSYDLETEPDATFATDHITTARLHEVALSFVGVQAQYPPAHSAVKVDGVRLYKSARKGIEVEIKPRQVTVNAFEITGIDLPHVHFRVACSKGTYIRSLVNDFGKALNSGAVLTALCRTEIGPYRLADAWQLLDFEAVVKAEYRKDHESISRT
jgi:tRNA pseudouridine55 synthase